MNILINGEKVELRESINLRIWLEEQNISPNTVIIEYNGEIIPQDHWEIVILKQGDRLEILRFVGGG